MLMPLLEYSVWQDFENAIRRVIEDCAKPERNVDEHFKVFRRSPKNTLAGGKPVKDYLLTRYACRLTPDKTGSMWEPAIPYAPLLVVSHVWYTGGMTPYLTARQAAKVLGKAVRTASRRALEAAQQGDPQVLRIGHAWAAPEAWWREQLTPRRRGRPKRPERDTAP